MRQPDTKLFASSKNSVVHKELATRLYTILDQSVYRIDRTGLTISAKRLTKFLSTNVKKQDT
jgi:hypothetical protein